MKKVSAIALLVSSVLAVPAVFAEEVQVPDLMNPTISVSQAKDQNGNPVEGILYYEYNNGTSLPSSGVVAIEKDFVYIDQNGDEKTVIGAGSAEKKEELQSTIDRYMNGNHEGKPETGDPILRPEPGKPQRPEPNPVRPEGPTSNGAVIEENRTNIENLGQAFTDRVDAVNDYLSQAGTAIGNNAANIEILGNAFAAQAAGNAAEIARLDGRIDTLEKKTDKLKAGIAGANAIASLSQYTGTGTHHVAIAVGGYDGEAAFAGGYTYALDKNSTIRATLSYDTEGEVGYGVSYGHSW